MVTFILLVAKEIFIYYITEFPSYYVIYGAIAAFPITVFWLFIVWYIILTGATLAKVLTVSTFSSLYREQLLREREDKDPYDNVVVNYLIRKDNEIRQQVSDEIEDSLVRDEISELEARLMQIKQNQKRLSETSEASSLNQVDLAKFKQVVSTLEEVKDLHKVDQENLTSSTGSLQSQDNTPDSSPDSNPDSNLDISTSDSSSSEQFIASESSTEVTPTESVSTKTKPETTSSETK